MNEALKMLNHQSYKDLLSAISSQESADGREHFALLIGRIIEKYGREAVLANLSARQAKVAGLLTSGTYGQRGSISYSSYDLQRSLENKLAQKRGLAGSTLFKLTCKKRITPSGRQIFALRASALRISGNDSTSWPTPLAVDATGGHGAHKKPDGTYGSLSLCREVKFVPWNTPRATDGSNGGPNQANGALSADAAKAAWSTPRANKWGFPDAHGSHEAPAPWATPTSNNSTGAGTSGRMGGENLQTQASGTLPTGSNAPTEKRGQLNPEHSRWLMGYPAEWGSCGAMAMQSCRKSRKRL